MRAPRLLALTAGALLLAGCGLEKPTPLVTVVSGGSSLNDEAVLYCFEGQDPSAEPGSEDACFQEEGAQPEVLRATPGDRVGVDVDGELARSGWQVQITSAASQSEEDARRTAVIEDEHYFSFIADFGQGNEPFLLTVRQVEDPEQEDAEGVWQFVVAPR